MNEINFSDFVTYSKKIRKLREDKKFGDVVEIGSKFIEWYEKHTEYKEIYTNDEKKSDTINLFGSNIDNNKILFLIDVLNEILIGSWYADRKDLSKKASKIIEKNIYGFEIQHSVELKLLTDNLNFNGVNVKVLPNKIQMFGTNNYGDVTSIFLIEKIFKVKLNTLYINRKIEESDKNKDNYVTMGSILPIATSGSYVWGSGYIRNEDKVSQTPKDIRAVRGPLTRAKLITQHIWCPKVFGDPAFLFPLAYNPKNMIKYKYGVIPHLWDRGHTIINEIKKLDSDTNKDYLYIDIDTGNRPYYLLNEISKCEIIVSSSLHGIIIAAAYKKPFIWCKFSDTLYGKNFKFYDFILSIEQNPVNNWSDVINCKTLPHFYDIIKDKEITIDNRCLYERGMGLLKSNPFSDDIDELIEKWKIFCEVI